MQLSFFLAANNPFPTVIQSPAVAQHEDTSYIIGGYYGFAPDLDTIYRFKVSDEGWTLMPNRIAPFSLPVANVLQFS